MALTKPLLVGESNPFGSDEKFALYPAPDGCSGHRLCCLILGMRRRDYLAAFDRINLCAGKWSTREATDSALKIWVADRRVILLGSKVAKAFGADFVPFEISVGGRVLVLPHPSGLCRLWNEPDAIRLARRAVGKVAPALVPMIGVA